MIDGLNRWIISEVLFPYEEMNIHASFGQVFYASYKTDCTVGRQYHYHPDSEEHSHYYIPSLSQCLYPRTLQQVCHCMKSLVITYIAEYSFMFRCAGSCAPFTACWLVLDCFI